MLPLPSSLSLPVASSQRSWIGHMQQMMPPSASEQQQQRWRRRRRKRNLSRRESTTSSSMSSMSLSSTIINNTSSVPPSFSRCFPISNLQRERKNPFGYRESSNSFISPRSVTGTAGDSSFLPTSSSSTSSSSSSSSPTSKTTTKRRRPSQPNTTSTSAPPSVATVVTGVAAVVATGVVNRLLYKASIDACGPRLALFLALLQASAPAAIYSLVLALRVRAGATSRDELDAPATLPLLAVGAGEASSSVLGFLSASKIPGPALPMLAQSMLVWQMGFERVFLKRRQTKGKLLGAAMVVSGVCLAAWPAKTAKIATTAATTTATTAAAIPLGAALVYIFAQSFPAAAALAKEKIFGDAAVKLNTGSGRRRRRRRTRGENDDGDNDGGSELLLPRPPPPRQLDTFVVSARASVAQAAVVAALLPLSALLGPARVPMRQLPSYLADGARAVAGLPSADGLSAAPPGCPWLPLSYVAANVLFNVALLRLLRAAGAFVYSAGAALLVPAAIAAFSVRWPPFLFFGGGHQASTLGPHFLVGAAVLVAGLGVVVASTSCSGAAGEEGKEHGKEAAEAAAAEGSSDIDAGDGDDEQSSSLLSPPLLGDVGLETA